MTFTCRKCGEDFEVEYGWDRIDVQCPDCKQWYSTDYEQSWDGITGIWLDQEIEAPAEIEDVKGKP